MIEIRPPRSSPMRWQAREIFQLGSNDGFLTLAADRTNEKVSHLYEPTHPGSSQLIKMTLTPRTNTASGPAFGGEIGATPCLCRCSSAWH